MRPFLCGACKRQFSTRTGVVDHIRATHRRVPRVTIFEAVETMADDDEPSIADRHVDALVAKACGDPVDDDWLLDIG